jgi:pimeloyl-ACP methyl ester carboxylesterase
VTLEHDPARHLDGRPRPIQVACWFPARPQTGSPLTVRDYFVASAGERAPASPGAERAAVAEGKTFFASVGVDGALVDRWLSEPVYARTGATAERAPFPLVLVAQGNGQSAGDQAILAEFLASRGFLVCTTPSQARLGTRMTSEADVLPAARDQAADLEIAERSARARFSPRLGAAALIGHSFGARSALLHAARHGAPALVSLDGGIGAAEARTWIDGAGVDRDAFATPTLHIYQEGDRAITPDLALLRSLRRADRTLVKVDGMRHIDFTSLGFGTAAVDGLTGKTPAGLADRARGVAALAALFLDAWVNGSEEARASLASAAARPWLHVEAIPPGR